MISPGRQQAGAVTQSRAVSVEGHDYQVSLAGDTTRVAVKRSLATGVVMGGDGGGGDGGGGEGVDGGFDGGFDF